MSTCHVPRRTVRFAFIAFAAAACEGRCHGAAEAGPEGGAPWTATDLDVSCSADAGRPNGMVTVQTYVHVHLSSGAVYLADRAEYSGTPNIMHLVTCQAAAGNESEFESIADDGEILVTGFLDCSHRAALLTSCRRATPHEASIDAGGRDSR